MAHLHYLNLLWLVLKSSMRQVWLLADSSGRREGMGLVRQSSMSSTVREIMRTALFELQLMKTEFSLVFSVKQTTLAAVVRG